MKTKRKFWSLLVAFVVAVLVMSCCLFAACGSGDDGEEGETVEPPAASEPEGGDPKDGDGDPPVVTGVALSESVIEMYEGDTVPLTATVTMSDGGTYSDEFEWSSEDEGIASVEASGASATVTAVSEGETVVTVTAGEVSAECTVTVYDTAPVSVTTADELAAALKKGGVVELGADMVGSFTVGKSVTLDLCGFSVSSEAATITVESSGSLTVTDSSEGETGKIVSTCQSCLDYDFFGAVETKGAFALNAGSVESASAGIFAEDGTVNIAGGFVTADYYAIVESAGCVTVNVSDGSVEGTAGGVAVCGNGAFGYWTDDAFLDGEFVGSDNDRIYQTGAYTTLNVAGGSIKSTEGSAVTAFGDADSSTAVVNVSGGSVVSEDLTTEDGSEGIPMPAIYAASCTLTISGGSVTGSTAVEIRGGTVVISGGNITSENYADKFVSGETGSGPVSYGYAVAVCAAGDVARNGSNVSSGYVSNSVDVTVTGGTFLGEMYVRNGFDGSAAHCTLSVYVDDGVWDYVTYYTGNGDITDEFSGDVYCYVYSDTQYIIPTPPSETV